MRHCFALVLPVLFASPIPSGYSHRHARRRQRLHDSIAAIHLAEQIRTTHHTMPSSIERLAAVRQIHRPSVHRNGAFEALDWSIDVEKTLRKLPTDQQDLLYWRHVLDKTIAQLAALLHTTDRQVCRRLDNAAAAATHLLVAADLIQRADEHFTDMVEQRHTLQATLPKHHCRNLSGHRHHRRHEKTP